MTENKRPAVFYILYLQGALNLQDPLGLAGDDIPYAQFGRAIVRVGDLNKDGFQGTHENFIQKTAQRNYVRALMVETL